jgi:hypothetical protein
MSFADCLQRALDDGLTDADRAQATQDAWREQSDRYALFMNRRTAEERAYQDIRDAFRHSSAIKRRSRLADLEVMRRNVEEVTASTDKVGAIRRPIERREGADDQLDSVRFEQDALVQLFQGMMARFFTDVHRDLIGRVKKRATLRNVARELHGEAAGDAVARDMADSIRKTFEHMRVMFNDAGGHISKLDDWGLPHRHNARAIEAAGIDTWLRETSPRMNWERIENYATGRAMSEASEEARETFLRDVYRSIITQDAPDHEPRYGPAMGGGKRGDANSQRRILHFRSADDWMAYNERFGDGDIFGAISGHIHRMARDIALVRRFGTAPRAGLEHRIQVALHQAKEAGDAKAIREINESLTLSRAMMSQVSGEAATPVREYWANFFSGVRQVTTSAYLGSAILASGGDWAAMRLAARSMGMNRNNVLSRHIKLMASSNEREIAAQLGYIADTLTSAGNTMARLLAEVPANEFLERVTSFVMRAQGLSFWTDMGRTAFRMEFSALFARNAGRRLADVDDELREVLTARGVTEADWAAFSDPRFLFTAPNGARFLSPNHWIHATDLAPDQARRIALRMSSIIEEQVEFAIPSMSVMGRAAIQGEARPGTLPGELALSGLSFKSFAMSIWINQSRRVMAQPTSWDRASYLAELIGTFTMMGAVSVQLKELAKGNDPRPMDSFGFWGAAFIQGGAGGVVADLFSTSDSRVGGLASYFAGPVVGLGGQAMNLTVGNALEAIRGEDTNAGRELSRFVSRNTPVASSLWQIRTAVDRMVFDNLQRFLDPEAERSMRTQAQNQMREFGNAQWWGNGDMAPSRAPDFGTMFGQ